MKKLINSQGFSIVETIMSLLVLGFAALLILGQLGIVAVPKAVLIILGILAGIAVLMLLFGSRKVMLVLFLLITLALLVLVLMGMMEWKAVLLSGIALLVSIVVVMIWK